MIQIILRIAVILIMFSSVSATEFTEHYISMSLDVESQTATVKDSGTVYLNQGNNYFAINKNVNIERLWIEGKIQRFTFYPNIEPDQLPQNMQADIEAIGVSDPAGLILFEADNNIEVTFLLEYTCVYNDDVENVRFSNENVGREVAGTILEKGAYLSSSSYFYPQGQESMATFTLTADIPASWESISDGNRIANSSSNGRKIQTWHNPYQQDGCMFMAAPYVVKSTTVDNIELYCYFFEEDTALIDGYLSATADYMTMYNELIGRYPYDRFTVAENFFPTGYGMPAWTLLGQQVIRLPFIKHTSLGHEVLHNWWGNSIYVDYASGNWCEGLTVYGADYRYKLLSSEQEAIDYRKNILKQYVSYVNEGNDFPIREFTSRTSPETRTIGYNKVMMLFHYIEELIGTKPFFDAWKNIYAEYKGKQVSWEDWINAYEKTSGEDLSFIIPEWVDRTGAPIVHLIDVHVENNSVSFTLENTAPEVYYLEVPVTIAGDSLILDTTVILSADIQSYLITTEFTPKKLSIDPDYHLFRQLFPSEIEPIISGVMGGELKKVYALEPDKLMLAFTQNILHDTSAEMYTLDQMVDTIETVFPIVINPDKLPDFITSRVTVDGNSITVDGQQYDRATHTFVMATDNYLGFQKALLIISNDLNSLPRLGQLIPHYGKYSYLVFEGSKNVAKGQWEVTDSPLKIDLTMLQ